MGTVKDEIIDKLAIDFDAKKIIQFGSSLVKDIYSDIDLIIVTEKAVELKNYDYQSKINEEYKSNLDLCLLKNEKKFIEYLNITNFKIIYEV